MKFPWASVLFILRGEGSNYLVADEGYRFIYDTAGYCEFFCMLH